MSYHRDRILNLGAAGYGACMLICTLTAGQATLHAQPFDSLFYVLQPDFVTDDELTNAAFNWLVLEPTRDGRKTGDFTPDQITRIQSEGPCTKTVLAYLSIGQAEDYRDYWNDNWVDENGDPIDGQAPEWLGPQDRHWPGNYFVRYWYPDWQALMFGTPDGPDKTPLDRIIDQGFDGVYLDIVDAYQHWSSRRGGRELTRMEARQSMIEFVLAIADYARNVRGKPDFLVFPQNASEIIRDDDEIVDALGIAYLDTVSGIGIEDLYYDETKHQKEREIRYRIEQIDEYQAHGGIVLVTDYVIRSNDQGPQENDARVVEFYSRCRDHAYIPYAALSDRDLKSVVTFHGTGWTFAQPAPGCRSLVGDLDQDGDVDLRDFSGLANCFTGQDGQADQPCLPADLDNDLDVDLQDYALMNAAWTGP